MYPSVIPIADSEMILTCGIIALIIVAMNQEIERTNATNDTMSTRVR